MDVKSPELRTEPSSEAGRMATVVAEGEHRESAPGAPRELDAALEARAGSRQRWLWAVLALGLVVVAVLVWRHYAGWESTDDAQIDGYIHPVSARIMGHVVKVMVQDNQFVREGTVLVELDPQDYQVALDRAKAELADAEATAEGAQVGVPITSVNTSSQVASSSADVLGAQAGITAAEKQYQSTQARLEEAEANNAKAQSDLDRYRQLVGKQEISQQQYDQAVAAAKASAATVAAATADTAAAQQQVTLAKSRLDQAQAQLRSAHTRPEQLRVIRTRAAAAQAAVRTAQTSVEQAELNLKYTTIVAPSSGIVGRRTVTVGQNVQPGQALMAIVPTEDIWVTANFKETQLRQMRPGQPAEIHVDAYNRDYRGHVLDIAGATGVQFSLLPPENATGNYVKVVQRVPVRIVFDQGQDPRHLLRLGLSVEPRVKVN